MSHVAFPGRLSQDDPELNQRQREVFLALLRAHVLTARPVSSEALVAATGVRGSPAAVRSVMAELETLGLLGRTHAASGRVPSGAGYAFFVRQALTPEPLPAATLLELDERLRRSAQDVEQLLHEAARVLSTLSQQLGLALTRSLEQERLSDLELAPLGPAGALLVLTFAAGAVRTLRLELANPLGRDALAHVEQVLRGRLVGRGLHEVRERLVADPELVRDSAVRMVAAAFAARWRDREATTLIASGAARIAAQPEFSGPGQLGSLLQLLEEGPPLDRLMMESVAGQAEVRVALDEDTALAGCSLVSYPLPGAPGIAVGVLGPLRMDYGLVLSVVDAVGTRLAAYL